MRLLTVMLLATSLSVGANVAGQTVNFSAKKVELKKIFDAIEKQTGYFVFASKDLLKISKPVTIDATNMPLIAFVNEILKDQPLKARFDGKTIFLSRKPLPAAPEVPSLQQLPPLRLRVTNATGGSLSGATVINKKTKKSVATDGQGKAELAGNTGDVLVISYIGHVTQEVTVGDLSRELQVILQASDSKLDEIQIIAYGTTSKRLNTGAVNTVKAEDIEKQPVSNPIIALAGRVPGLTIQQTTGAAGAAVRFNIRGQNSLSGANDPFIIVDGVPFNNTNLSLNTGNTLGAFGGASPLNAINPADIERMEVLKDADATAIYGSRGANGVILITTKKGKSGKTGFNVNVYHGIGQLSRKMKMLTTRQYLDMRYEAFANDGVNWRNSNITANDLKVWDTTRYTNWIDELAGETAQYTSAQIGLSGGNQYTQFTLNGSYWKETTVHPGPFHNSKYSGRFGVNHRSADDRFRIDFSTFYTYNENLLPAYNPYTNAISLAPNAPALYNQDGNLNWENGTLNNPLASMLVTQHIKSHNLTASGLISYRLWKGLWIKANIGYSKVDFNTVQKNPKRSQNPANFFPTSHIGRYNTNDNMSWNAEPYLEYQERIGPGKLSALLGITFQAQSKKTTGITSSDFLEDVLMDNPAAGTTVSVQPSTDLQYRYNAVYGRLNYNVEDKYIANLTMRRDGSSRFGPGRQFGNFGAIGLVWIFSEEKFTQFLSGILSYGKLRTSYGITGSDAIGDYGFLSTYSLATNASAGRVALKPDRLYNPDFGWETNKKADVELELGFLNDRIMVAANYYRNRSSNQLVGIPMPALTGFTSINANLPATVENTGFEFSLNTVNIKSKDFTWSTSFNLSLPRNKLIDYPNLASSTHATSYAIGYSLQVSMLYNQVGVDPLTGLNVYRGANGKDTSFITSQFFTRADRTSYIDASPRVYGGMTNEFQYKNFSLDFQLLFSRKYRNNDIASMNGVPGGQYNIPEYVFNNSWRKLGDHTLFQKFTQSVSSPAYRSAIYSNTDAYFSDVYYVRLNNLFVSYRLPEKWQKRVHTNSARIYLQGQNLFSLSNFKGVDPETATTSMPLMRVLTAGVQFNF